MNAEAKLTPKGRETRARLLGAAADLYAQRGYTRVRISDITGEAGVSQGAFYRYFSDKYELTLELFRDLTEEAFEFARTPYSADQPEKSVIETTRKYFEYYSQRRAVFGVLVEMSQAHPEVAAIWGQARRSFYDRIANSLRRGAAVGNTRADVEPDVAAELLGSMTEFYAFQRFVLQDGVVRNASVDDVAETLAKLWVAGLSVPR